MLIGFPGGTVVIVLFIGREKLEFDSPVAILK